MISPEDAFLVLGKWAEEETRLCVFSEMDSCRFVCFGVVTSADFPMVRFLLDSEDFIDIYLPETARFEYGDPDAMRLKISERTGFGNKHQAIRYGATICAVRDNGDGFVFVEVMGKA